MKASFYLKTIISAAICTTLLSCGGKKESKMGSYAYDADFLKEQGIEYTELVSPDSMSKVMVVPAWQGRVLTSTASGDQGDSYGWINYRFIKEGKTSAQFNPVGGEERFWLGPEGGPFSLYFKPGAEQVYENWVVPTAIDTEPYEILSKDSKSILFHKKAQFKNASGTVFDINIDRKVALMDAKETADEFGIDLDGDVKLVAYRSDNRITNAGEEPWTKEKGLVSVWMLGCFNPTPTTTVFIPYKKDAEGKVVNDEYFGKIRADRLAMEDGIIYFKIDGKYRSKLGLPASRATEVAGSYDSSKGVLTILKTTLPDTPATYLNGQWGKQDDPFDGDVINSYNDGPVEDGSVMGPFYEIETSSPGAELKPGESLTHSQKVIHIQADDTKLAPIVRRIFGADLETIKRKFQ